MPRTLAPSAQLIAEGRSAAPVSLGTTAFLTEHRALSEVDYKRSRMAAGEVMYHAHVGLSTWEATEGLLRHVHGELAARGHRLDRFGVALDRAMGVPAAQRSATMKETGPRLDGPDWSRVGSAVPIQPHLGDYMIGFPAGGPLDTHARVLTDRLAQALGQQIVVEYKAGAGGSVGRGGAVTAM